MNNDRRFTHHPTRAGGWEDMDLDQLTQQAQAMQPGAARTALERGIVTERQRRLWATPLYAALKAAGITITPHADDPSIGWFMTCPVGQYGPYPSPEDALTGGLAALVGRAVEDAPRPDTDPAVAAALTLAIETLQRDKIGDHHLVKDWQKYGDQLQFQQAEARRAAQRHEQIDRAVAILEGLRP